jgi:hypothetical protein
MDACVRPPLCIKTRPLAVVPSSSRLLLAVSSSPRVSSSSSSSSSAQPSARLAGSDRRPAEDEAARPVRVARADLERGQGAEGRVRRQGLAGPARRTARCPACAGLRALAGGGLARRAVGQGCRRPFSIASRSPFAAWLWQGKEFARLVAVTEGVGDGRRRGMVEQRCVGGEFRGFG